MLAVSQVMIANNNWGRDWHSQSAALLVQNYGGDAVICRILPMLVDDGGCRSHYFAANRMPASLYRAPA